jgi:CRISPR-associated protein Cas1
MGWRSVVITQPAYLSWADKALVIRQGEQHARVPLEDVSVLVIDNPQVTLTIQLLSACAEAHIVVITVNTSHHPNGLYLPFLPHSRALKIMRTQMAMSQPLKKQLRQRIIQQKIRNQSSVLEYLKCFDAAHWLNTLADQVRSGDPDNKEAQAAQQYFKAVFGVDFNRAQNRFFNAALDYGYAVLRAAIARTLVCYGFLPAFGLFHVSEQNAFNLADDLIEPYRPFLDDWVCRHYPAEPVAELSRADKAMLVSLLHEDITLTHHQGDGAACTVLAAIEATIVSLARVAQGAASTELVQPCLQKTLLRRLARIPNEDSEMNE